MIDKMKSLKDKINERVEKAVDEIVKKKKFKKLRKIKVVKKKIKKHK